jgi:hypothetical protein
MSTMIVIACPMCLQKIRAPEGVIGRQIKCPQCKNGFTAADPKDIAADVPAVQTRLNEVPAVDPSGWDGSATVSPFETPPPRPRGTFLDYLIFRRMVTPIIIVGMFYLGAAVILLIGLVYGILGLLGMFARRETALLGLLSLLVAFFSTIVGLVMWRVFCEVLISVFRILDNVREINLQLKTKDPI